MNSLRTLQKKCLKLWSRWYIEKKMKNKGQVYIYVYINFEIIKHDHKTKDYEDYEKVATALDSLGAKLEWFHFRTVRWRERIRRHSLKIIACHLSATFKFMFTSLFQFLSLLPGLSVLELVYLVLVSWAKWDGGNAFVISWEVEINDRQFLHEVDDDRCHTAANLITWSLLVVGWVDRDKTVIMLFHLHLHLSFLHYSNY